MASKTVMARVYPADLPRLDEVRRWLQMQDGNNANTADAVHHLLDVFAAAMFNPAQFTKLREGKEA